MQTAAKLLLIVGLLLCLGIPAIAASSDRMQLPTSCTNILVGKGASATGRAMLSYSADGGPYGRVCIVPACEHASGSTVSIFENAPRYSYQEYQDLMRDPPLVTRIPQVPETYRYIDLMGWYGSHWGGINEHGVTLFETTIGGRPALVNSQGAFGVGAQTVAENSLLVLALQRARTAREAISIMTSLAEEYGYYQPEFHGENISITDGNEVWILEIFGPGPSWHPGSDEPGAVWCAQRIPDDHICVSANRSRIGEIEPNAPETFLCSANTISLAVEMGWWHPSTGTPFIWYEAYAPCDWPYCSLREWRVLDTLAPSLELDPDTGRFPLSVRPDELVNLTDIMALHRDAFEGTPYNAWENPARNLTEEQSRWIYPYYRYSWIDDPVQDMLGVRPERTLAVWSSFSCIAEIDPEAPPPVRGCLWYGQGPAATTCYVPIYTGVKNVPDAWKETDPTGIDWVSAHWAFSLVHELARHGEWQIAYGSISRLRDEAEEELIALQDSLRNSARQTVAASNIEDGCILVTEATSSWLTDVVDAYWDLVDYLLFTHYFPGSYRDPQNIPSIDITKLTTAAESEERPPVDATAHGETQPTSQIDTDEPLTSTEPQEETLDRDAVVEEACATSTLRVAIDGFSEGSMPIGWWYSYSRVSHENQFTNLTPQESGHVVYRFPEDGATGRLTLQMQDPGTDLSSFSGIEITVRTNRPMEVQIEMQTTDPTFPASDEEWITSSIETSLSCELEPRTVRIPFCDFVTDMPSRDRFPGLLSMPTLDSVRSLSLVLEDEGTEIYVDSVHVYRPASVEEAVGGQDTLSLSEAVTATSMATRGVDGYAVILEVDDHPGDVADIMTGYANRNRIVDALLAKGWSEENMLILLDHDVTVTAVQQAMDWVMERVTEEDLVFIYACGHGGHLRETVGLGWAFPPLWRALPTDRKVLVVNSCGAGRITGSAMYGEFIDPVQQPEHSDQLTTGLAIAGCAHDEQGISGAIGEGLPILGGHMTFFLHGALNDLSLDANHDLFISVEEAFAGTYSRTRAFFESELTKVLSYAHPSEPVLDSLLSMIAYDYPHPELIDGFAGELVLDLDYYTTSTAE